MRLLLAGDTHGNFKHLKYLLREAKKAEVEAIVQVGDFGFSWPGKKILPLVHNELAKADLDLYWLDGNHDNYTDLIDRGLYEGQDGPVQFEERIHYLPRGGRWEWDGVRFLSLGGGVSIDKARRIEGLSWWPQEIITPEERDRAKEGGKVDVMLTHDAPSGIPSLEGYLREQSERFRVSYKLDAISTHHREQIREVANEVRPRLLVHGHYHHRYTARVRWGGQPTETLRDGEEIILGLDRDTSGSLSWVVLDTADWVRNESSPSTLLAAS